MGFFTQILGKSCIIVKAFKILQPAGLVTDFSVCSPFIGFFKWYWIESALSNKLLLHLLWLVTLIISYEFKPIADSFYEVC